MPQELFPFSDGDRVDVDQRPKAADHRLVLFREVLDEMFGRAEFLHPFVAAQEQFRQRYYGLASAAMLEDLFFDALASFIRNHRPNLQLERAPKGQRGVDYSFERLAISHKVSKAGAVVIAALWDATVEVDRWTFESPICLIVSGYSSKKLVASVAGTQSALRPLVPEAQIGVGEVIVIGRWIDRGSTMRVEQIIAPQPGPICDVLPFDQIWRELAPIAGTDSGVNELEVLITPGTTAPSLTSGAVVMFDGSILRPGAYLLDRSWLRDLSVERNNRAVLVPKSTVVDLMHRAVEHGTFSQLSIWFSAYAGLEPPDLYLTQRISYDRLFSGQL